MNHSDDVRTWAVSRAQQILMREGMDLAMSAQDFDKDEVRARGKRLAMAIASSLMEASTVHAARG